MVLIGEAFYFPYVRQKEIKRRVDYEKKSNYISQVPPNISKKNLEGISNPRFQELKMHIYSENHKQPGVWNYYPEVVNSIDYKVYKEAKSSERKPGFNNGEKR